MEQHRRHDGQDAQMKNKEKPMNLIDRYVAEVGRQLPEKSRADIETELRSTLEDMLEDRSRKTGRPADDELTVEVLKEFGHPRKVAASYLPEQYLIGPQLYPYFIMVIKISLLVAFIIALVGLSVGLIQAGLTIDTIIESVIESMARAAGIAITVIGNVVLVFAIMEKAIPYAKKEEISLEWDPRSLPEVSKSEAINSRSIVGEIIFTLAALVIFNFYPQILGIGYPTDGKWVFIPVLSSAFFVYLPWLNIHWSLEILRNAMLLRQGRWQPATRWFSIGIGLFGIGITYAMLNGPALLALTPAYLQSVGISRPSTAAGLTNLINAGMDLGLIVAIIVQVIQVAMALYQLLSKQGEPVLPNPELNI
jgi:hypothetical protein